MMNRQSVQWPSQLPRGALLSLCLVVALSACFSERAGDDDDDHGGGALNSVTTPDGLRLAVPVAEVVAQYDQYVPEPYWKVFHAAVEVTNGTADSISVAPLMFRLRDDQGAERLIDPTPHALGLVGNSCPSDILLAPNGHMICNLAFALPFGSLPTQLVHQRMDGSLVTVALSPTFVCTECSDECVDPRTDPAHCGGCALPVAPGAECVAGVSVCPADECAGGCVDLQTDSANCGLCDSACPPNAACQGGQCGCNGNLTMCDSCVNTMADPNHCGSCSHRCSTYANWATCESGSCYVAGAAFDERQSCEALCGTAGLACVSAEAIYEDVVNNGTFYDCYGSQHTDQLDCAEVPLESHIGDPAYSCVYDFYFIACDCSE